MQQRHYNWCKRRDNKYQFCFWLGGLCLWLWRGRSWDPGDVRHYGDRSDKLTAETQISTEKISLRQWKKKAGGAAPQHKHTCSRGRLSEFPHISASLGWMACYFVEAAPHGDAVCTLMNLCLPAWEHMDREAEERMERHEAEGQSQASSRSRWQWDGGRWGEKEEEGEEMIEWKEGPLVAHVLHLLLPSFACQRLSQSPQTGKIQVFSLLCRYQEIIICCSVFHTDNQDNSEQDKLPHEGVKKKKKMKHQQDLHLQQNLLYETLSRVVVIIGLQNALAASSICSARNQERWF